MVDQLALFPLNTVLYPGMPLPLHIFEERYRRMLRIHGGNEPAFGVVLIDPRVEGSAGGMHLIGTAARLVSTQRLADGRSNVIVTGTRRFRVTSQNWSAGYCIGEVTWLEDPLGDEVRVHELLNSCNRRFNRFVEGITRLTRQQFQPTNISHDPAEAAWDLATRLPLHTWERQQLLELGTIEERLAQIRSLLQRELALLYEAGAAGLAINHPAHRFLSN
jgi:Lon protease-like protein